MSHPSWSGSHAGANSAGANSAGHDHAGREAATHDPDTHPTSPRVTGLLLAAGSGSRYGHPKALVEGVDGRPWVLSSAHTLLKGGCGDVLVVTGAQGEDVENILNDSSDPRISWIRCGTWEQGMGESLRSGLTALATRGRTVPIQALIHLVDLPDIGPDVVARLLATHPTGTAGAGADALVRAAYRGASGHPVLLGQAHWQAVLDLAKGDAGARSYLRRAQPQLVECGDLATGLDIDSPTDIDSPSDRRTP
ncbi:nucleotidyltransferase family protein [Ornithinimicrobium sp. Y1847]|uniref:nucleotidyltransferase family protein n=1 Tax=Ornithinimicrobium sp. Y1847 TaxID=3405419 RepID=UPI003B680A4E